MTWLALPWFVLVTSGSATKMGIVAAVELAGIAVCGIPGGAVSARLGARRTLLVADGVRGPLVAAVPVLHWTGSISFPLLLVIVFALGAFTSPHFAAGRVALTELLGDDERLVTDANAFLQVATRLTLLLGPLLAGLLIGVMGAAAVLLIDAATYVVSALLIAGFVPRGGRVEPDADARGLLAGLRFVMRDRLMRTWTWAISIGDAAWNALFVALPYYAYTRYDGDARLAGALLACFGIAAIAGNALSFRIRRHLDGPRLIGVGVLFQAAPLWLLAGAGPAWIVALALILSGVANGVVNPSLHALLTMRPPTGLRTQALSAEMTVVAVAGPVGFLLAGPALDRYGVAPVFLAVAVVQSIAMGAGSFFTLREEEPVPALLDADRQRDPAAAEQDELEPVDVARGGPR